MYNGRGIIAVLYCVVVLGDGKEEEEDRKGRLKKREGRRKI